MRTCLIRQPAGLGDILFLQKIALSLLSNSDVDIIYWPVIDHFSYLKEYLGVDHNIHFIPESSNFLYKDIYTNHKDIINGSEFLYIPFQFADLHIKTSSVMKCKYEYAGNIDFGDWKEYVSIRRNYLREDNLRNHLGVDRNEELVVVNRLYGSPPNSVKIKNDFNVINKNCKIIEMEYLGFDNLFDWIGIFEQAIEVHTVETAIGYILSIMNKDKVNVYPRLDFKPWDYMEEILPRQWKYYENN